MDNDNTTEFLCPSLITNRLNDMDVTLRGIEMVSDDDMSGSTIGLTTISSALESARAYLTVLAQRGEWSENMQRGFRRLTTDVISVITTYCSENDIELNPFIEHILPDEKDEVPLHPLIEPIAFQFVGIAVNAFNESPEPFDIDKQRQSVGQLFAHALTGMIIIEKLHTTEAE